MNRMTANLLSGARGLWRGWALLGALIGAVFSLLGCGDASSSSRGGYSQQGGQWRFDKAVFTPEDPATFEPLSHGFARDARRGYYRGTLIEQSDGASLQVLGEHEARDRQAVYYADTYRKGQEYWLIRHVRVRRSPAAMARASSWSMRTMTAMRATRPMSTTDTSNSTTRATRRARCCACCAAPTRRASGCWARAMAATPRASGTAACRWPAPMSHPSA
ncbi:MAG: DKNYY domain-containing protein [Burkholderiales bacterium]|nr:DKNYY domain-containing protein [Burkholderiales bacterium]